MNLKLKISPALQGLVFSMALLTLTPSLTFAASTVTESGGVKTAKPITLNELPSKKFMSAHGAKPDDGNSSLDVPDNVELISLYVGEATTLPVTNVSRVAVGNGKLITANVIDGREILLLGENPGDTSLFIWSGSKILKYRVKVNSQDIGDLTNNVQSMIKDLPNVKIDRVGDQIALSGTASKQDLKKLDIITQSTKQVINLVREEDVTLKKMVYIKVQFMEFRRTALQNLGIDWATSINGPSAALTADVISNNQFRYAPATQDPTFTAGQGANAPLSISSQPWRLYLGLATTLTSRINLAISNGDAGVLASPELATRSGGEAKFLAGGQVPLPVTSPTGQVSVSFKDYGIKLNISPVVDDNNLIQAKLDTEVSAIDNSVVVQGIPGFTTRSTSSDINLKSGQTIVMSGLVNQSISNSINKFPWLGDVPILGNLFKSKNFQSNRSDLVMFVTPVVIDPASTANQQRLDKGKEMREKFDGMLGKKGIVD